MKTIAQQIKWDFEANGYLEIEDKNGNQIYFENSGGFWLKSEYNSRGNRVYFENSNGDWIKREYNSDGNEIYWEDSDGVIIDIRPKSCEGEEIVIEGVKYKLTKV